MKKITSFTMILFAISLSAAGSELMSLGFSSIKDKSDANGFEESGPGDIVQLKEGVFYLHKSLYCYDFDGTLKGSGKHKTTIQTAPGVLFDVSDCPDLHWPWGTVKGHFVICILYSSDSEGGTFTVSDLKIHVTERASEWLNAGGVPQNRLQAINVHNESLIVPGDLDLTNQIDLNVNY